MINNNHSIEYIYQFFIQQAFAKNKIRMRKVSYCFQHDLDGDVQIIIVMELIDFEYSKVCFQIVHVFLRLYFNIVFKCGQMLRIVSKIVRLRVVNFVI